MTISSSGLTVEMEGPEGLERLGIRDGLPGCDISHYQGPDAKRIFSQFALTHLVAGHLPRSICSDIPLARPMRQLIRAMYRSENCRPPRMDMPVDREPFPRIPRGSTKKAIVAFSAGKDSLWNVMWAQKKYGEENVYAVHLSGLNRSCASQERDYAKRQSKECGFPVIFVDLLNSSGLRGYSVMRFRDMFLVGAMLPVALSVGASRIITEGFEEEMPSEPFSGKESNMRLFNRMLGEMGMPVNVEWKNLPEMDIVREMYENRPEWMPHVCNCFCIPCRLSPRRRYWQKTAPSFPLYDSQCGSCIKCRITNIGRILYDPAAAQIAPEDIRAYLRNTLQWIKTSGAPNHADMICGSFLRDVERACKLHGIEYKAAA